MLKKARPNSSTPHYNQSLIKLPSRSVEGIVLPILFFSLLLAGAIWANFATPQGQVQAAQGTSLYPLGNNWNLQNPLPQINSLHEVSCPTTGECYAVGDKGVIINRQELTDPTWKLQSSGVTQTLTSISCSGPGQCLAVGEGGTLLRTDDSGSSWTPLSITTTRSLNNLVCLAGNGGVCYVSDGYNLFKTTDRGNNWASVYYTTTNNLTALSCPQADNCYLVSKYVLSKTTDGGQTWNSQVLTGTNNVNFQESYGAIECPSVTTCYVLHSPHPARLGGIAAASFQVIKTTDGGQTWTTLFTSPTGNLTNITCPDITTCYTTTTDRPFSSSPYHAFYKTTDGGQTWQPQDVAYDIYMFGGPGFSLASISCPTLLKCSAVGGQGEIFTTTDGGLKWQNQLGGVIGFFQDLDCFDIAHCYVAASDEIAYANGVYTRSNYLVRTDNAGGKWTAQPAFISNSGVGKISCPAKQLCYMTSDGPFYETSDGGQSWISHTINVSNTGVYLLKCPSVSVCYGADAQKGTIYKTSDGGQNWVSQVITTSTFQTIECPDLNTCYAGGAGLFKTDDGGQTWNLAASVVQPQGAALQSISCPSSLVCYVSPAVINCPVTYPPPPGQKPCFLMYKTTDGGLTWNSLGTKGGRIECPGLAVCYLDGYDGKNSGISYSTDGGVSWWRETGSAGDFLKCPLSCVGGSIFSPLIGNYNLPDVAHLELTGPPTSLVDQSFSLTLTARTVSETVATTYTGTVHLSITVGNSDGGGGGGLPTDYTFTASDSGVHTFQLSFDTPGPRTITATDGLYRVLTTETVVNVVPPCTAEVVTSASDDGSGAACGTLSYALLHSQLSSVPVTISLASPVITLTGSLPVITPTVAVSINGGCTSAGVGSRGVPGVKIVAGSSSVHTAFTLTNNITLNGVSLSGFSGYGVVMMGDNNTLTCSQVGPSPISPETSDGGGIRLVGSNNRLGLAGVVESGNSVYVNRAWGILVEAGSRGNRAYYNKIEVSVDGTFRPANGGGRVQLRRGGQLEFGPGNSIRNQPAY